MNIPTSADQRGPSYTKTLSHRIAEAEKTISKIRDDEMGQARVTARKIVQESPMGLTDQVRDQIEETTGYPLDEILNRKAPSSNETSREGSRG